MTFNRTWTIGARAVAACCLLSACGSSSHAPTGISCWDQRLRVARAAETAGNMVMARSMYAGAASDSDARRDVQLQAAEGLARIGAPADAIIVLQTVLIHSPRDQEVRRTLGSLQIMNGQPEEAVKTLAAAVAAQPDDDAARINEAVALDMVQRHTEAQALYRVALAKNPTDPEAANDLALSLMLSGQTPAAKAVLAPFRGNPNLPDRMRTTMNMVDGAPGGGTVGPAPEAKAPAAPAAPVSLKSSSQAAKAAKTAKTRAAAAAHKTSDQTPDR